MYSAVKTVILTIILSAVLFAQPHVTSVETSDWNGFTKERLKTTDSQGKEIFFNFYHAKTGKKAPCIIAFHGATSSKHEWDELDEYTKGGNIVKALLAEGYSFITLDAAHHGEHYLNRENSNYDSIFENDWESFFTTTMSSVDPIVEFVLNSDKINQKRLGLMSYSMGSLFAFRVANNYDNFKTITAMVPANGRKDDDEYAPYNNQKNLKKMRIYINAAENDEYIPLENQQWFKDKLNAKSVEMATYKSGHSLPIEYVSPTAAWIEKNL